MNVLDLSMSISCTDLKRGEGRGARLENPQLEVDGCSRSIERLGYGKATGIRSRRNRFRPGRRTKRPVALNCPETLRVRERRSIVDARISQSLARGHDPPGTPT